MPFKEWLSRAREYQTCLPAWLDFPHLPSTASELPGGTLFVIHGKQPFAIIPPEYITADYTPFSHRLGPYRARRGDHFHFEMATDVPIDGWFALADEAERKAFGDGFNPELLLKDPPRLADFPPGTTFYEKEAMPIVIYPDSKKFNWYGGRPREWTEYTASQSVVMGRDVSFQEWLLLLKTSIRESLNLQLPGDRS
jgi:hypothetical protein